MTLNLRALIGRLDATTRRALEAAAGRCLARSHYEVELEHWLCELVQEAESDIPRILRHFGIAPDRFLQALERALDRLQVGNSREARLSPTIPELARAAWVVASIDLGQDRVRSGAIFLAALADDALRRQLIDAYPGVREIPVDGLARELLAIVAGSLEDGEVSDARAEVAERDLAPAGAPAAATRTPALDRYTLDLTAAARAGSIDPLVGRDLEIRQIVDVLMRRRQNNPILTGEAGVGKTAVV